MDGEVLLMLLVIVGMLLGSFWSVNREVFFYKTAKLIVILVAIVAPMELAVFVIDEIGREYKTLISIITFVGYYFVWKLTEMILDDISYKETIYKEHLENLKNKTEDTI